jgi:DNA-directed RNA polymerase beta subunit
VSTTSDVAATMLCAREGDDDAQQRARVTRVLLNGAIVGAHADPARLFAELKALKRSGAISVFTSVVWTVAQHELTLCTDGGRFLRPVLVVDDGDSSRLAIQRMPELLRACLAGEADWHSVVLSGAVEYLDVDEVNTSAIAMGPDALDAAAAAGKRYTHVDVAPSAMLGVVAGSIPFSDHNQAPRNTYQVTFSLWGADSGGARARRPRAKA